MIFDIRAGDIAIGSSGSRCEVLVVEGDYVAIAHPTGEKRILINKVARFERPHIQLNPGDRVGKRFNLGWHGQVHSPPIGERVEVLWQYNPHPTMENISDIKLRTEKLIRSDCRAV